jgi:hypothetical protein
LLNGQIAGCYWSPVKLLNGQIAGVINTLTI